MSEDRFFEPNAKLQLDDEQRISWLRLIRSENVGPITFRALLNRFGGAQAALEALPKLAQRGGAKKIRVASREEAESELAELARLGAKLLAPGETGYPPLLRYIDSPPPLLTVIGQIPPTTEYCVAIVGSRNASAAGRRLTRDIAAALGKAGYLVISGLARGIDAAAHEAALPIGTIAVLAGGLNRIYPPENQDLLRKILETGAAISEMPIDWQATARDFPRRNRLVSGMSLAVIIVEAAERSGSLITARLAGEQGREVFAVPGSPLDPRAAGTNRLLKEGATMVTNAEDILDVLAKLPLLPREPMQPGSGLVEEEELLPYLELAEPERNERQRIIEALGPAPIFVDTLIRETGIAPSQVHAVLLELELAGRLEYQGGQRVALTAP